MLSPSLTLFPLSHSPHKAPLHLPTPSLPRSLSGGGKFSLYRAVQVVTQSAPMQSARDATKKNCAKLQDRMLPQFSASYPTIVRTVVHQKSSFRAFGSQAFLSAFGSLENPSQK